MILNLAIILSALAFGGALGFIGAALMAAGKQAEMQQQYWAHIKELEADKRALTESLCRAEGKPFIVPRGTETLAPSDGWYDAAVQVQTKEKIDA